MTCELSVMGAKRRHMEPVEHTDDQPFNATEEEAPASIFASALVIELGLLMLAMLVGWFLEPPPLEQIDFSTVDLLYGLVACVPLLAGLVAITQLPWGPLARLDVFVRLNVVPLFVECRPWQIAVIALLAGIGEEALFRGVIQAGIEQYFGSPAWALAIASALFGLAHLITPTYAVLAGLIGAYLGWLMLMTDNLLTPIVAHGAYDFAAILYLLRRERVRATNAPPLARDQF
jgi:membrane protease YdiL (CAAX protease family)